MLDEFAKVHPRIIFTIKELDKKINYLGISVEKVHNRLKLGIYVNLQPQT
jgi:hypothetical protein